MSIELEEYREFAPKGTVDLLYRLSELVEGRRFLHVSAVRYGGGTAEVLRRLVPIMRSLGIEATWEVISGVQEFFDVTRRMTNALQGHEENLTEEMYDTYLRVNRRNAQVLNVDADLILIHIERSAI